MIATDCFLLCTEKPPYWKSYIIIPHSSCYVEWFNDYKKVLVPTIVDGKVRDDVYLDNERMMCILHECFYRLNAASLISVIKLLVSPKIKCQSDKLHESAMGNLQEGLDVQNLRLLSLLSLIEHSFWQWMSIIFLGLWIRLNFFRFAAICSKLVTADAMSMWV